jgi:serine/threonine protein kinase
VARTPRIDATRTTVRRYWPAKGDAIATSLLASAGAVGHRMVRHFIASEVGDLIGERFRLEAWAGRGSMGSVFRARDLSTGQQAAVKLLQPGLEEQEARFVREAELLSGIRHPRIVSYVDHGLSNEGEHYLAMEWLEGETVAQRLQRSGLTLEETVGLILSVADALEAAHGAGLVHRDVKPQNLFLVRGEVQRAKLLDFGAARPIETPDAMLTSPGGIVGTPGYMAPEQAQGSLDSRTDIFALGCLFFRCLTGQVPFAAANPMTLLFRTIFEPQPSVRAIRPDVPEHIDALIARMMAKDPLGRPSARELATELSDRAA